MYFGAWSSFYKEIRYLLYRKETFANNLSCCSGRWSNGDIISLYPTKKNPKVTYLHSILVDFLNWTHKTHFSSSSRKRKPHFVFRTAVILVQQTITLGTQKNRIPETICNLFYGEKKNKVINIWYWITKLAKQIFQCRFYIETNTILKERKPCEKNLSYW